MARMVGETSFADGLNKGRGDRANGVGFLGVGPAGLQPRKAQQPVVHFGVDEPFRAAPTEDVLQTGNVDVDGFPHPARGDHLVPHGLQLAGAEPVCQGPAVEFLQGAHGDLDAAHFSGHRAVLPAVVLLRVAKEGEQQLVDCQAAIRFRELPTAGQPFGYLALVLGLAHGSAVAPEVVVFAAQGDHSLAGRLVLAITRNAGRSCVRHWCKPFWSNPVVYRISQDSRPH